MHPSEYEPQFSSSPRPNFEPQSLEGMQRGKSQSSNPLSPQTQLKLWFGFDKKSAIALGQFDNPWIIPLFSRRHCKRPMKQRHHSVKDQSLLDNHETRSEQLWAEQKICQLLVILKYQEVGKTPSLASASPVTAQAPNKTAIHSDILRFLVSLVHFHRAPSASLVRDFFPRFVS